MDLFGFQFQYSCTGLHFFSDALEANRFFSSGTYIFLLQKKKARNVEQRAKCGQ